MKLLEAVVSADIDKILSKYLQRVKDPNAKNDFLKQAATFLGRKSSSSPEELDLVLRKHYAKNYDPAKLARRQTPSQKVAPGPPPLPTDKPKFQPPAGALPPLSKLAKQEPDPGTKVWQQYDLPPPSAFGGHKGPEQEKEPSYEPEKSKKDKPEDIPTAKPSDVIRIDKGKKKKKEKEVDVDKLGEPMKKAASAPADLPQKEKPAKSEPRSAMPARGIPIPPFSSLVKPKLRAGGEFGDPKWKVGDVVNIGKAGGGYQVMNKTGSWYNLERDGQKYVFIPFQGLRKIRSN